METIVSIHVPTVREERGQKISNVHFIPTADYRLLVASLVELVGKHPDAKDTIVMLLGTLANIWPRALERDPAVDVPDTYLIAAEVLRANAVIRAADFTKDQRRAVSDALLSVWSSCPKAARKWAKRL